MIAFFDASALIYLVEGVEPFAKSTWAQVAALIRLHGALGTAVSRLSWLECRVRPARARDLTTLAAFDRFFGHPDLHWVDLTRDVVELATEIRVRHGLRTPDALQSASCLQLGPDHVFITGDSSFNKVSALNVKVVL